MHAATNGGSEVGTGSRETLSRLPRAGLRHSPDDVRLVRQALNSDAVSLSRSPLCELPGVVALARRQYAHKVYPEAAALRALLAQAYTAALAEIDELDERRARLMATYLRLARQGVSVAEITRQLGLRSRSYVHRAIQRQAMELITDAFLTRACQTDDDEIEGRGSEAASVTAAARHDYQADRSEHDGHSARAPAARGAAAGTTGAGHGARASAAQRAGPVPAI